MLKKILDLRIILGVLLIASWAVAVLFFMNYKNNTEEQIALKDEEITSLETQISEIGELVPAYAVASNVVSGKQIEESDLEYIDVPLSMATNLIRDSEDLIGKYFKMGMTAGSVITIDDIYEEVITPDMRYYDVLVDVYPIGLKKGAFVDIRIKYGTGSDYVAIAHRQVAEINGNCLKLILTENDILTFSSLLVDDIVFNERVQAQVDIDGDGKVNSQDSIEAIGAYIYAVEYIEGGVQGAANSFYSPSVVVQAVMQSDPNLLDTHLSAEDMALIRNLVRASVLNRNESKISDFDLIASKIRDTVAESIKEGRTAYEKRVEKELEAAQNAE